MSTRSLTHIYEDEQILLTFYRHSDGYPSGHGMELAKFLNGFKVCNGIGAVKGKMANGMGCLAAQVIKHFKEDLGGVYIYPAGSKNCGEEYTYAIRLDDDKDINMQILDGTLEVLVSDLPKHVIKAIPELE